MMMRGVLAGGVLLAAELLLASCGDGGDARNAGGDSFFLTPVGAGTPGMLFPSGVDVADKDVTVGQPVAVTGSGWNDSAAVSVYLLTEDQFAAYEAQPSEWLQDRGNRIQLGETSSSGGMIHFAFDLPAMVVTADGKNYTISSGDTLYLGAFQSGDRGARGVFDGPLRVQ